MMRCRKRISRSPRLPGSQIKRKLTSARSGLTWYRPPADAAEHVAVVAIIVGTHRTEKGDRTTSVCEVSDDARDEMSYTELGDALWQRQLDLHFRLFRVAIVLAIAVAVAIRVHLDVRLLRLSRVVTSRRGHFLESCNNVVFVLIAHAVAHVNLLRAVELRRLGVRPKPVEVKRAGVLVAFVTLHHQQEACRLLRNLLAAGLARAPSTRVDLSYGVEGMLRSVALGAGLHAMRYIERGRV